MPICPTVAMQAGADVHAAPGPHQVGAGPLDGRVPGSVEGVVAVAHRCPVRGAGCAVVDLAGVRADVCAEQHPGDGGELQGGRRRPASGGGRTAARAPARPRSRRGPRRAPPRPPGHRRSAPGARRAARGPARARPAVSSSSRTSSTCFRAGRRPAARLPDANNDSCPATPHLRTPATVRAAAGASGIHLSTSVRFAPRESANAVACVCHLAAASASCQRLLRWTVGRRVFRF